MLLLPENVAPCRFSGLIQADFQIAEYATEVHGRADVHKLNEALVWTAGISNKRGSLFPMVSMEKYRSYRE